MRLMMMIPYRPEYPARAVADGAKRLGWQIADGVAGADALITWSPWAGSHRASIFERFAGRPRLVMENGWLSPIGGERYFQLAHGAWNDPTATFFHGDGSRWAKWGVPLWPWRGRGADRVALVVGQRGHPTDPRTAKRDWHEHVQIDLSWDVIRRGRGDLTPFGEQLAAADRVVVWTSNAASHAVVHGVPVHYCGPTLMVEELARAGLDLDDPVRPEREPVLERLAWAQWNEAELAGGEPLLRLLGDDKTIETCRSKFANVVNFRGVPNPVSEIA